MHKYTHTSVSIYLIPQPSHSLFSKYSGLFMELAQASPTHTSKANPGCF